MLKLELFFKGNVYLKGSEIALSDKQSLSEPNFDAGLKFIEDKTGMFLEINIDGTPFILNLDYFGKKRSETNLSPGPFEIINNGKQKIKVFNSN